MNEVVAEFYVPTREPTESEFSPDEREQVDFDVRFKTTIHNELSGRERENCHPINAITGLSDELDKKVDKVSTSNRVYGTDSNGNQTTYDANSFGQVDDVQVDGTSVVQNKIASLGAMAGLNYSVLIRRL